MGTKHIFELIAKISSDVTGLQSGLDSGISKISGFAKAAAGIFAGLQLGKMIGNALNEGGQLEQSLGGVETLFKDSADEVKKNAANAFKTSGLSANEYMQNVTGFSASLLQSLGGDTKKAAKVSDMAMQDMSDNANKMGTSMESITTAYQGFAKQNYTMLDNLKLGYGGTKTEMERLLKDAEKFSGVKYDINNLSDVYEAIHVVQTELDITGTTAKEASETIEGSAKAMKASWKDLLGNMATGGDVEGALSNLISTVGTYLFGNLIPMVARIVGSLPKVVSGIIKQGIPQIQAGAADLIKGLSSGITANLPSLIANFTTILDNIMYAIQDFLPILITAGADLIGNLVTGAIEAIPNLITLLASIPMSFIALIGENLPVLVEKGRELISTISTGIQENLPLIVESAKDAITNFLYTVSDYLPVILEQGLLLIQELATGIWNNLPAVVGAIGDILSHLIGTIIEVAPTILSKGFELIGSFAMGLWNNLPSIISTIGRLMSELLVKIGSHLPDLLEKGWELIKELAGGLLKGIPDAVGKIPEIIQAVLDAIKGFAQEFVNIGFDLLSGMAKGIGNAVGSVVSKAKEVAGNVVNSVKNFLGIRSPSRLMRDEVGVMISRGLADGIDKDGDKAVNAMTSLSEETANAFDPMLDTNALDLRNLGVKTGSLNQMLGVESQIEAKAGISANIVLNLGKRMYETFVADITQEQDRLELLETI